MRIALVVPSVNLIEGVPHYVASLGDALSAKHEVHFVAGAFDASVLGSRRLHKIPTLPWGKAMFHATFLASMYLRHASAFRSLRSDFDIVHGAGYTCPFANVTTAHFLQVREQRLSCNVAPLGTTNAWCQITKGLDHRLYSALSRYMEGHYYRSARPEVVIAVSRNVKTDLIREFNVPSERIVIIPNGVDTERFHPTNRLLYRHHVRFQLGLDNEDVVAIFVGNSWERKGLGTAVKAVLAISNPRLKLLVVGTGNPYYYAVPQEPEDHHPRVIFVNRPEPRIERYYAAADLLIFPTFYEPFGLVVLEAMASGLPVIVSATAGVSEHITDGETGLLVNDPADPDALQVKLELLLSNTGLREKLTFEGRLLAEKFTWDRIAALTGEAYLRALSGQLTTEVVKGHV